MDLNSTIKRMASTPACAGLTEPPLRPSGRLTLYPRVRGADVWVEIISDNGDPLPPRARG